MKLIYSRQHLVFEYPHLQPVSYEQNSVWVEMNHELIDTVFADNQGRAKDFKRFLTQGALGLVRLHEDAWQAYGWLGKPDQDFPPHLPKSVRTLPSYWIFYCRTHERYQGQGLYKALLRTLLARALQEDSANPIYIDTSPDNIPARKAIAAIGFLPRGMAQTLNVKVPKVKTFHSGKWNKTAVHPASVSEQQSTL